MFARQPHSHGTRVKWFWRALVVGGKRWEKRKTILPSRIRHKLKNNKKSRQLPNETTERERGSFYWYSRERRENRNEEGDTRESVATGCKRCPTRRLYGHFQHIPSYRSVPSYVNPYSPVPLFLRPLFQPPLQADNTSTAKGKRMWERERRTEREREENHRTPHH